MRRPKLRLKFKKLTANHIELAVAHLYSWRENIIVPNVSWGLQGLGHEADMLIVNPQSLYTKEIEIKVSASDIMADLEKRHGHHSDLIKELYFAVPEALAGHCGIPQRAGIIAVSDDLKARVVRRPEINRQAKPLNRHQLNKVLHLGVMRIWSLKTKLTEEKHKHELQDSVVRHNGKRATLDAALPGTCKGDLGTGS